MFSQHLPSQSVLLAQATQEAAPAPPATNGGGGRIWMFSSAILLIALVALGVYGKMQIEKLQKSIRFEQYKAVDLQKRLKLALKTIQKMEKNPDLVHSREFNLDYLRLRMDEEVFHYAIVNQVKIRVKELISVALRPSTATQQVGIAATGRQIDETFDVTYETETRGKRQKRVLFRTQIKLTKLPTQSTSTTISQIIDCIEKYLSPNEDHENWQPTIQGRVVLMDWDQKAKPTPLLVLEQSGDGVNVSFRTNPNRRVSSENTGIANVAKAARASGSSSSSKSRSATSTPASKSRSSSRRSAPPPPPSRRSSRSPSARK